jgi:asparagine synthase (glutamine-hydrolysing)
MPRQAAEQELARMMRPLRHESFYVAGTWIDESLGVYAGWVTRDDGLPVVRSVGRNGRDVILALVGEEFDHSATGELSDLNGRFHGLVMDRTAETATLFNDRYGLQRVYVHDSKDALYFAAEAKAILAVRPELRRLDPRGLGELIACGCVLDNRTLFDRIRVLPPGAAWTFRGGTLERKGVYFSPSEWEAQSILDDEPYYVRLRERFCQRLPRYFGGRDRIGLSLTGGLDTRMIVAWHKAAPGSLPCYSFGGAFRDCQDVVLARRVAATCGQPHQVIPVGDAFLAGFARYAERSIYLTDGCASVAHAPDLYLNERVREISPVRMTGNYGGEVLRHVRAFKAAEPASDLYCPELARDVRRAAESYAAAACGHPLSFSVFRQAPWHHYGLLALEQTQVAVRTPFLDNHLVATVFRAPQSATTTNAVSLRLIADGDPALLAIRTDRGVTARRSLPSRIHRRLLDLSFKAEYAYDYGMPQSVARIDHLLSPLGLERLFLGRHKFAHFRIWYRDALSRYVREMLLDTRSMSRPYLVRKTVERVVKAHLEGKRNYTSEIHQLLTLELVHRLFVDGA